MRIKGVSVQSFFPVFLKYRSPASSVSETSTTTMFNILATYAQLAQKNDGKKISVTDIVKKSGYSRTTFYTYFSDTNEIIEMLEDIISFHMYTNADVYYNCFLGKLSQQAEDEFLLALEDFGPYINALLQTSPGYANRYKEDFRMAFEKTISVSATTKETQAALADAICASMAHMVTENLRGNESLSFRSALDATKIIFQNLIKL